MTNPSETSDFIDDSSLVKPVEIDDLRGRSGEIVNMNGAVHKIRNLGVEAIRARELNPDGFKDYLELHKNGTPPHGGCGIWLERVTLKLLGGSNIRETTLFPRDLHRLTP